MADISQDIFDQGRRIKKILFQQHLNLADFELNELQDMVQSWVTSIQRLSGGVGPVGDGFLVEANLVANEVVVRKGLMIVDGAILFLDEDTVISGLSTPGGARTDFVFAWAAPDEKDEATWPDILNPAFGTQGALRIAWDLEFQVWEDFPGSPDPVVPVGTTSFDIARLDRTANPIIAPGEIVDFRYVVARSYHDPVPGAGGKITDAGGLTVDAEAATGKVRGVSFTVSAGTGLVLTDDATNYVTVTNSTTRTISTVVPLFHAVFEAVVVTAGGAVTSITDTRIFRSQDQHGMRLDDLEAAGASVSAEVVAARGSHPLLDARLDVSLNEDGTLKPAAAFGGAIEAFEISTLRPGEQTVPNMTVYVEAGEANYGSAQLVFAGGSSPVLVAPSVNDRIDLLYLDNLGALAIQQGVEAAVPSAPSHAGKLPIAEVYLTTAHTTIVDGDITDVRPFLNLGGSGSESVFSRLQLALNDSVFNRAILDPLDDDSDLGGTSNGTLLAPGNYLLNNGEVLETSFAGAPTGASASISQVGILVLASQELVASNLTVEVDDGNGFEAVSTWTGVEATHTFSSPASNILNLRLTNVSGASLNIEGYALMFENNGGLAGFVDPRSGVTADSSGMILLNTSPAAFRVTATDFKFIWDAANNRLSWGAAVGAGDDLTIEVNDYTSGIVTQTLPIADSPLNGVIAGSYVYFDMDRVSASVTLAVSAGPPDMAVADRFILGRRIVDANGGNDQFVLFGNHLLHDITSDPSVVDGGVYPPPLVSANEFKYVALTGGTVALSNTVNTVTSTNFVYNVADFTGANLSTSKIRGIWIRCVVQSDWDEAHVKVTFPDGTSNNVARIDAVGGGSDDRHEESTIFVPVNAGQTTLTVTLARLVGAGGTAAATADLLGAWQVG